ncbi:MAG: hypothetical protein Q3998_07320 [Porphyromonas sp.]|nr:hypothetical protein [Porphyromonas sp.]
MIRKIATIVALALVLASCDGSNKDVKKPKTDPDTQPKVYKNLISKVERYLNKKLIGETLYEYDENNKVVGITNIQLIDGKTSLKTTVTYPKDRILIKEEVAPKEQSNLSAPTEYEIILNSSKKVKLQTKTLHFSSENVEHRVEEDFLYNQKGQRISRKTPAFEAVKQTWEKDNCIQEDRIEYPRESGKNSSSVFYSYTDNKNDNTYPDLNSIWTSIPSIESLFADELGIRSANLVKRIEYTRPNIPTSNFSYEFDKEGRVITVRIDREGTTIKYFPSIYRISYKE